MLGSFKHNIWSMSLFSKFKVQISVFYNDFKLTYCYDGLCKKPNRRTAKKVWWQIEKKEERGWKSFLFFCLTSRSRRVAVRHLPLPVVHILNYHSTLQYLKIFEGEPRLRNEWGAKWAQVIFSNVDKPWWQTASWWRQGRSGCQRSSLPPHCGKGEAAFASPAKTLIFSFSLLYITFSCVRWNII